MSSRGPYPRLTPQFKMQHCGDIRAGTLGRRDAQKKYALSANLIQM
jgi:transposase